MDRRAEAYVDTSALIGFLDRSDSFRPLFRRLFAESPPLVTSALVIVEGHAWFLRRYGADRALQFLDFVRVLTPLAIQAFDAAELAKAERLARKFAGQKLTLADAHGLAIMSERRSRSCWSTDHHLGLTGVPLATG